MVVTLAKMAANTATIQIPYGGDVVNVTFYPGRVTDKNVALLDGNADETNEGLLTLIKSWDLMLDEDTPCPIDLEHLADVPWDFKVDVARAIMRDIRPEARAPRTPMN